MDNPLQSFTFILTPALLTNASSLLLLSTSNRFARVVDRTRLLAKIQSESKALRRIEQRALILVRALTSFYLAVGAFACSTFTGLLASALQTIGIQQGLTLLTEFALAFATIGVLSIALAAALLVRETWIAYGSLIIEAKSAGGERVSVKALLQAAEEAE